LEGVAVLFSGDGDSAVDKPSVVDEALSSESGAAVVASSTITVVDGAGEEDAALGGGMISRSVTAMPLSRLSRIGMSWKRSISLVLLS
jgi:hypothetical protein